MEWSKQHRFWSQLAGGRWRGSDSLCGRVGRGEMATQRSQGSQEPHRGVGAGAHRGGDLKACGRGKPVVERKGTEEEKEKESLLEGKACLNPCSPSRLPSGTLVPRAP